MSDLLNETKKRILIVDDDTEVLEVLRSYLEPDYLVGTVNYGEFVIEYIKQNNTDLILMDVMMPVMDGFELFQKIRQMEEGSNIPVIFVTGKSDRNNVLESINLGVDGYLLKPVSKEKLRSKINDILIRQESMTKKKVILAVDDDVTYLKIINNSLKDNFNVIMVNSTKLAIDYLKGHIPDILLLDFKLAPCDGQTVMEYVRSREDISDIPVIMMTGINDKKEILDREKGIRPDKFLLKPVSKLDLLKAIISSFKEHGKSFN